MVTDDLDTAFNRQWAQELTSRAVETLRIEMIAGGKETLFNALKPCLAGGELDRSAVAEQLRMTDGAMKVAVHRLRGRYREILRAAIEQTVADSSEVDDEMRQLVEAL